MQNLRYWIIGIGCFLLMSWPLLTEGPPDAAPAKASPYQVLFEDVCTQIIRDSSLYTEGWDTLIQPQFWRRAMQLPPDTVLVNIAATRQILDTLERDDPILQSAKRKEAYEDSVKQAQGMRKREELFFTSGRNHFYRFKPILPEIDRAIDIFQAEGVDPWYAQAILLIESPGRLQYSVDGAYGAFQLMAGVAREQGLVVNDTLDERRDFDKSAMGAARLIRTVCLVHTRRLCQQHRLPYEESDIWFRLLTMHVYHAGIGNVRRVVRKIRPERGGIELIQALWQTKSRRFGNASQNYSQIILAAMMELDALVATEGIICDEWPHKEVADSLLSP